MNLKLNLWCKKQIKGDAILYDNILYKVQKEAKLDNILLEIYDEIVFKNRYSTKTGI